MKFNMGCGKSQFIGFTNVDAQSACNPDIVYDLNVTPWPWVDNCADEVHFIHSMEHMGADTETFLNIMKELYRICKPGAMVRIVVPHPRSDDFIGDPTHVRAITISTLSLFDRQQNLDWQRDGYSNTPLALYTGVDFQLTHSHSVLDEPFSTLMKEEKLSQDDLADLERHQSNVVKQIEFTILVRKPEPIALDS
jgi:hypothetical protein